MENAKENKKVAEHNVNEGETGTDKAGREKRVISRCLGLDIIDIWSQIICVSGAVLSCRMSSVVLSFSSIDTSSRPMS